MQAEIAADEARWIAAGADVEAEYLKKWIDVERVLPDHSIDSPWAPSPVTKVEWFLKGCVALFCALLALLFWRRYKKSKATPPA